MRFLLHEFPKILAARGFCLGHRSLNLLLLGLEFLLLFL
jgi:hypothetical protein